MKKIDKIRRICKRIENNWRRASHLVSARFESYGDGDSYTIYKLPNSRAVLLLSSGVSYNYCEVCTSLKEANQIIDRNLVEFN